MEEHQEQFDVKVHIIDYDDVPSHQFPFFVSYRMFFDEQIKCYGFFVEDELVAVTAVIPNEPGFEGGFVPVGCPIIYVFEVREDMRRKGMGYKCAQELINNVIEEDTIQLCCSPFVQPFWSKVGFEITFFDQTLYMNKMILKKEEKEN
ncbi:MAG: GNAT family N-acetyltransferase [Candidatus Heimdallarchaeota archaeon]|nr:GNAT family N-acetyltransferase [Candidatus Heimdallarchaeota archaeon]